MAPRAKIRSVLEMFVNDMPEKGIPAQSIKNRMAKAGVKPEELKWSGVGDVIPTSGMITKDHMQELLENRIDHFSSSNVGDKFRNASYMGEMRDNPSYRENVTQFRGNSLFDRYSESHFSEKTPDYLYHTRSFDEISPEKNTRVVPEIQSDLHQIGRDDGYATIPQIDSIIVQKMFHDGDYLDPDHPRLYDFEKTLRDSGFTGAIDPDNKDFQMAIDDIIDQMYKPPESPYKKDWFSKAAEREIHDAVNAGQDQVRFPIAGKELETLLRGDGVQKWYEDFGLGSVKKLAKKHNLPIDVKKQFEGRQILEFPEESRQSYLDTFERTRKQFRNRDYTTRNPHGDIVSEEDYMLDSMNNELGNVRGYPFDKIFSSDSYKKFADDPTYENWESLVNNVDSKDIYKIDATVDLPKDRDYNFDLYANAGVGALLGGAALSSQDAEASALSHIANNYSPGSMINEDSDVGTIEGPDRGYEAINTAGGKYNDFLDKTGLWAIAPEYPADLMQKMSYDDKLGPLDYIEAGLYTIPGVAGLKKLGKKAINYAR